MMQVILEGLRFHSTHGLHKEEALTGGEFEVNLTASYEPDEVPVQHIHQTIDYTILYQLIKERMNQRTDLLESIATDIAIKALDQFPSIQQVNISIKKLHPPIVNFQGAVGVSYELKRNV
jgi:dihydroneopterin aldolase